ncbi:MAG: type IV pilus modification PilV family protein [Akkermansiaceae bacterium]
MKMHFTHSAYPSYSAKPVNNSHNKTRKGFLLMEALLAFSIFGIAVTSIVVALNQTAKVSYEINRESWSQTHLQKLMREVITLPVTEEEFPRDVTLELNDATAKIVVTPYTDTTQNEDSLEVNLENMYEINITLYWDEDGIEKSKSANTVHYYPLHQTR